MRHSNGLKILKKYDVFAVGVDAEQGFLTKAKTQQDNTDGLIQAIAEKVPLRDESFDIVLLFEVLEHVKNPKETLVEINRVLKRGGTLFVTVPNRFFLLETHGLQIGNHSVKNLMGLGIPFFSMVPDFLRKRLERARIYSQSQLVTLLESACFETVSIKYLMPPLDVLKKTALTNALRKMLYSLSDIPVIRMFGANIMVLSKKK